MASRAREDEGRKSARRSSSTGYADGFVLQHDQVDGSHLLNLTIAENHEASTDEFIISRQGSEDVRNLL